MIAYDAEVVDVPTVVAEGEGGYAVRGELEGDGDGVFEVEAAVGVDAGGIDLNGVPLRRGCGRC